MDDLRLVADEQEQTDSGSDPRVQLSVLVPISDRVDDLRALHRVYTDALAHTDRTFELIYVLDGPQPAALASLREMKAHDPSIHVLTMHRNFGEGTALAVGFKKAQGEIILTLPSYLQVDVEEIPRLIDEFLEGDKDLMVAWRRQRVDSLFNRAQSAVFHGLTRMLTGTEFHDLSCGLRIMRRGVATKIPLYGDLHRFFPLLAYQRGFRTTETPVRQSAADVRPRVYRPGVYLRRLLDILTLFFVFRFTKKPLRFFGVIGSVVFGMGTVITGYLGLYRLLGFGPIGNRPLVILGVLLMVLGIQLFSTGLLGEIITFTHARNVKDYEIQELDG
jgi:glycosyltransferase involved in cell wall biosynthesis